MAQAYDDEELSISLSPSQIRRNRRHADDDNDDGLSLPADHHHGHHGQQQQRPAMSSTQQQQQNGAAVAPLRDKARTEQRIGAYNIVKTLGEGSFGKVKLAVHRSTGQQVALKIISRKNLISRDMQGRVEREIEYLQLLRHPHIIKLYVGPLSNLCDIHFTC